MPRASFLSRKGKGWGEPRPPEANVVTFPAPAKGINAVDPMATMSPEFCTYLVNMVPDGQGVSVRNGFAQFASGLGANVRTVIPFQGLSTVNDKLFAVTSTGIYDITAGGAGPWVANLTFGSTGGDAGWGNAINFTSDAGTHYGFYADEVNGLYRITEGGAWGAAPGITVATAANLSFVTQYKKRIWMVERGTTKAWYLPAGAISGAATVFDFGNKFVNGGTLVGLYTWTLDGGDGVDDYLVAISTKGDVIAYRFTDPSSVATYEQTAQYYVGPVPLGRRIACQSGGELFLLCQYGVVPMSRLVSGHPVQEQDILASRNITPLLTQDLVTNGNMRGWELSACPAANLLIINTPKIGGYPYKQYAMSTKTSGWGVFNSVEYLSAAMYGPTFYIGDEDGVNSFTGHSDDVLLATGLGSAITFSIITAFSDIGAPGIFHQAQFVRSVFRSGGSFAFDVKARFDYNTDDFVPTLSLVTATGSLWDTAIWDTALWGVDSTIVSTTRGASGIGRAVGAVLTGQATTATTLLRLDVIYTSGSML